MPAQILSDIQAVSPLSLSGRSKKTPTWPLFRSIGKLSHGRKKGEKTSINFPLFVVNVAQSTYSLSAKGFMTKIQHIFYNLLMVIDNQ